MVSTKLGQLYDLRLTEQRFAKWNLASGPNKLLNKKKKSLINDGDSSVFLDGDDTRMLADDVTSQLTEE